VPNYSALALIAQVPVAAFGGDELENSGLRCSVCLSNSKQLSHNQTVLMTSHYFDFDAVTHSIKDVSVLTRQSLASSELFRIHG